MIAGLEYNPYLITFLSSQNKEFHSKQIAAVAFSPNGRILAGSMIGEITLWDAANRKPLKPSLVKHPGPSNNAGLTDLAFSPDGKLLASCGTYGEIILWDVEHSGQWITLFFRKNAVHWFSVQSRRQSTSVWYQQ